MHPSTAIEIVIHINCAFLWILFTCLLITFTCLFQSNVLYYTKKGGYFNVFGVKKKNRSFSRTACKLKCAKSHMYFNGYNYFQPDKQKLYQHQQIMSNLPIKDLHCALSIDSVKASQVCCTSLTNKHHPGDQ